MLMVSMDGHLSELFCEHCLSVFLPILENYKTLNIQKF